ncbi:MAG TPA: DUF4097 family beta strand repeat-containing protein [Candidatus Saccharicenans sp.]|jgi:DUF4097 and DUF4098 domain-containing protein YvlB|nr:DUF4097 family beta strand repeat protein [Candidatus Saccharicenans sp.]HRD01261.1 DUF4097 family beta strand repeat-containing protein [Candidatus Saccharicenans sp.]
MRAKEVIILILIILAGVGLHYFEDWHLSLSNDQTVNYFISQGKAYNFEETLILEPAATLEIINSHGGVEIEGSDRPDAELTLKKTVWDRSEKKASSLAQELKLLTSRQGTKLILSTNRDTFRHKNFSINFRLSVPASTSVRVSNSFGPVRIASISAAEVDNEHGQIDMLDIAGRVKVSNSHEKLTLLDIGGACQVETRHSPVSLIRISGPVSLKASHEDVELTDLKNSLKVVSRHSPIKARRLTGPVELEGSYEPIYIIESGQAAIRGHHSSVEIDNLTGPLDIETDYEPITLTRINGDVTLRGKGVEIDLSSIRSEKILIETSYEDVKLKNFTGDLHLNLAHGDASLFPASLRDNISVSLQYGDLSFFWPAGQLARLEARSKGGRIDWKLPLPPDEDSSNGLSLVRAFHSAPASPEIKLSTTYGDIKITQQEPSAFPDEDEPEF